jgi:H-type lectin domain
MSRASDEATRYNRVETGHVEAGFKLNADTWRLHLGSGDRTFSKQVRFSSFHGTPVVALCLSGVDCSREHNLRVKLAASHVDRNGFTMTVTTWDDTILYGVWATWTAAYIEP